MKKKHWRKDLKEVREVSGGRAAQAEGRAHAKAQGQERVQRTERRPVWMELSE